MDIEYVFEGMDCQLGEFCWIVIEVDFVFGLNFELCVVFEVYVFEGV